MDLSGDINNRARIYFNIKKKRHNTRNFKKSIEYTVAYCT